MSDTPSKPASDAGDNSATTATKVRFTYFQIVKSLTDDAEVHAAVDATIAELREPPDTSWVRTASVRGRYRGRHRRAS